MGAFPDGDAHAVKHARRLGEVAQPVLGASEQGDEVGAAFAGVKRGPEPVAGLDEEVVFFGIGGGLVGEVKKDSAKIAGDNGVFGVGLGGLVEPLARGAQIAVE